MSRHAARDEAAEESALAAALRAALERRRAAEQSGQAPRRRRGSDDAVESSPEVGAPHAPVPLGWPAADPPGGRAHGTASAVGWPGAAASGAATGTATLTPPAVVPEPETAEPDPAYAEEEAAPWPPRRGARDPSAGFGPPPLYPTARAEGEERPVPGHGWRRVLYAVSGGLLNPGESSAEKRRRALTAQVVGTTAGCHRIAVISLKGGVGKTTMSVCLGAVLASLRPDRVIAVDANPDRGTLAGKVTPQTAATVRDLLEGLPRIASYADVRAYTSQTPDRLEILASAADPAVSQAFGEQDYRRVVAALEDFYNVVVTDCGTGLLHSAMTGVLDLADQLVVVATNSVDGANSASATLDWLQAHGREDLVRRSVAVVNAVVPGSGRVDQERLVAHFAQRCRAVVQVPHDLHLEAGAEVELAALAVPTRDALLELAAAVSMVIPSGRA